MSFEEKYLKYKEKYLKLRSKFNYTGGAVSVGPVELKIKIYDEELMGILVSLGYEYDGINISVTSDKMMGFLDVITSHGCVLIQKGKDVKNEKQLDIDELTKTLTKLSSTSKLEVISNKTWKDRNKTPTVPKLVRTKLNAEEERIDLDIQVPSTHAITGSRFKLDNTHCRVFLVEPSLMGVRERALRVIFDTGNSANTLISEKYITEYGLKRISKNASKLNISKFNLLMSMIGKKEINYKIESEINLRELIEVCLKNITEINTLFSTIGDSTSVEDKSVNFGDLKIPLKLALFLELRGPQGVGGSMLLISEYTIIDINVPTTKSTKSRLQFRLSADIVADPHIDLLVSNKVMTNLQLLGYSCSEHIISMIGKERRLKELAEHKELLDVELQKLRLDRQERTPAYKELGVIILRIEEEQHALSYDVDDAQLL